MAESPLDILKTPPGDKREWRRFCIELTILVEVVSEDEPEEHQKAARSRQNTALVTDISMNGLFFVGAVSYEVGAVLDIQLTLGTQRHAIRGQVSRVEDRQLPGRTAHGCAIEYVRTDGVKAAIPAIANYILKKARSGQPLPILPGERDAVSMQPAAPTPQASETAEPAQKLAA